MPANKLKEINLKNCTYYYHDNLIDKNDLNLRNILVCKISHKDLSLYYTKYKIPRSIKDMYIIFRRINGCIKDYNAENVKK